MFSTRTTKGAALDFPPQFYALWGDANLGFGCRWNKRPRYRGLRRERANSLLKNSGFG